MTRPVFFLTDFGLTDTYVGVVKAVILSIAPQARIHDLTHGIAPQDVRAGAYALLTAAPYLPRDAVILAVVDPGVGSSRRPIAVQVGRRAFVGPDNGMSSWALRSLGAMDDDGALVESTEHGTVSAVVLDRRAFWLPHQSATFHGRDIFGPVAAHLANGVRLANLGTPTDQMEPISFPAVTRISAPDGTVQSVHGEIIHADQFGNLISNIRVEDVPPDPVVIVSGHTVRGLAAHYQSADGPLLALIGSGGFLEVAAPNGSAASVIGVTVGAAISVTATKDVTA